MDFTALKTAIQNAIKLNGNEEITGDILQGVLLSMVSTLGDSAINDLVTAISNEATTRQNADGTLQNGITALQTAINGINSAIGNGYVYAGIATPSTTPATGKVFYIAIAAGTYTNFGNTEVSQGINILKYDGSAWSLDVVIALDDAPTPSSNNLVKSGGVFDKVMIDGSAFDISAHFASGGTLATYADLSAALTALNTLSASYKKGGMSIKFVQSSDNKYVQFRYMSSSTAIADFTNVANWQGVDNEPTAGSDNLVKSRGVTHINNTIFGKIGNIDGSLPFQFYCGTQEHSSALDKIPVNIKQGEQFSVKISLETAEYDGTALDVRATKSDDSVVRLDALSIDTEKTFTASFDIKALSFYIYKITKYGTFVVNITQVGQLERVENKIDKGLALCWTRGVIDFDNTNKKLTIPQIIQLRLKSSNVAISAGEIPFNWTLNESSLISLYYDYNQQTLKFGYYLNVNDYPVIATFYGTGTGNADNVVQRVVSSSVPYTIDAKIADYDEVVNIYNSMPGKTIDNYLNLSMGDFVDGIVYNIQGVENNTDYKKTTSFIRTAKGAKYDCSLAVNVSELSIIAFDENFDIVLSECKSGPISSVYTVDSDSVKYLKFTNYVNGTPSVSFVGDSNEGEGLNNLILSSFKHAWRKDSVWQPKSLVLQVFSDIHGAENELMRIVAFYNKHSINIDNCIHLGDNVYDTYADSFDFWNEAGAGFILNCIGNHDGRGATVQQTYARYFKPYISQWGVVQPSDAEEDGKCYYYKDYATQNIRLIVLDSIAYYDAQHNWFVSVLNDAQSNGFSVVVACHYGFADYVKTYNTFDMIAPTIPGEFMQERAETAIDDFIDAGGEFICWLTGHTHMDCFVGHTNHPRQYEVRIDTAKIWDNIGNSDLERIEGTESEDLFNLVAIDTNIKTVSILRIGAQWDRTGRHRHTLCWDYANRKLINES